MSRPCAPPSPQPQLPTPAACPQPAPSLKRTQVKGRAYEPSCQNVPVPVGWQMWWLPRWALRWALGRHPTCWSSDLNRQLDVSAVIQERKYRRCGGAGPGPGASPALGMASWGVGSSCKSQSRKASRHFPCPRLSPHTEALMELGAGSWQTKQKRKQRRTTQDGL